LKRETPITIDEVAKRSHKGAGVAFANATENAPYTRVFPTISPPSHGTRDGEESEYQFIITLVPTKVAVLKLPGASIMFGRRYDEVTWMDPETASKLLIEMPPLEDEDELSNQAGGGPASTGYDYT